MTKYTQPVESFMYYGTQYNYSVICSIKSGMPDPEVEHWRAVTLLTTVKSLFA